MTDDNRRWYVLVLVSLAQFLVVLDASIVNVAMPAIQDELDFSPENLQWVVNAYALTFGGFLLLGGRMADLFGRKRVFMAGLVLFALASLAGGFATSEGWLIAARAVQGLGAAIISPAALSIVTTTFDEGADRNKALGVWGAVAGAGGAVGVLLGGILTDTLGWEWVLFVNVPIAFAALLVSVRLLTESMAEDDRSGFDVLGAVLVTGGLALLIFTLVNTTEHGWGSSRTLLGFAGSAVLLVGFVAREATARAPLVRLGIFSDRTRSAANVTAMLSAAALFAMFFFLSLYLQQVLGASALRTGLEYLPLALTIFVSAGAASAVVTKVGVRPPLIGGFVLVAIGLFWFSRVSADGSWFADVLFPSLIVAVGMGFAFVAVTLAATAGVAEREAGLASGVLNTSQQVGGALGLAILSTLANTRRNDELVAGASQAVAATEGFQLAFLVGAGFAVAGAILAYLFVRPPQAAIEEAERVGVAA